MTESSTRELLSRAQDARRGVGAFNVVTLEHAEGIVRGAERAGEPVILQLSEHTVTYHASHLGPLARACREVAGLAAVPVAVHLDHATSAALCHEAFELGLSSVMFDASSLDYDANVAATRAVAGEAHERGLLVEAELGEIGGKDGVHAPHVRTDPGEAARFVAATGVDALAVAVGTSHAMTEKAAVVDLLLVERLRAALGVPLVLHGSSGVPDAMLASAVRAGIRKVNVGTELNQAFTLAVRGALDASPSPDPRRYLGPARDAVADAVERLLCVLAGPDPAYPA